MCSSSTRTVHNNNGDYPQNIQAKWIKSHHIFTRAVAPKYNHIVRYINKPSL